MRILLFICLTLYVHCAIAQLSCGTDRQYNYLMGHSEAFRTAQQQKKPLHTNLTAEPAHPERPDTIPVVVHIISIGGKPGSLDNPADSSIQSMIDGLNRYFNATYPDDGGLNRTAGVDIGVYFKLVTVTASCEPTNGIMRIDGSGNSTYVNSGVSVEGLAGISQADLARWSYWDNTRFLNIWLVNKLANNAFLGYGFYPTGTRTIFDGVVVHYKAVNRNYILAHEIGHAFSLFHTFNGSSNSGCAENRNCEKDGDEVCDTDPVQQYTNGCYSSAVNPCTLRPYANIVYNHMGYSCGAIFTEGQKSRMRASLLAYRNSWFGASTDPSQACTLHPVQFLSIETKKVACNSVQLQWQTTFEQNCKSYAVEVSNDGINFYRRALIDAKGSTTDTMTYSYTYPASVNGKIYFRIKQIALDGWSDYSALHEETISCVGKEYTIYPNPVTQWATITTGSSLNNDIIIYNAAGQKMNQWLQTAEKKFDLGNYESGIYIMVINGTAKLRFIKH